jgi:hypothetical protein
MRKHNQLLWLYRSVHEKSQDQAAPALTVLGLEKDLDGCTVLQLGKEEDDNDEKSQGKTMSSNEPPSINGPFCSRCQSGGVAAAVYSSKSVCSTSYSVLSIGMECVRSKTYIHEALAFGRGV